MKRLKKIQSNQYQVVDKLVKGDYIFIHYNGYIFKANSYPYNLRDGMAARDMLTGEVITLINDRDTADITRMPEQRNSVFSSAGGNFYNRRKTDYANG